MNITLVRSFDFEAAQALPLFPEGHKCRGVHGHSFRVEVSVTGPVDPATGLFFDHARISEAMKPLLARVDHTYLNEVPGLEVPTIERLAKWFWDGLAPALPGLSEIKIWETPRAWCVYRGD